MRMVRVPVSVVLAALVGGFIGSIFFSGAGTLATGSDQARERMRARVQAPAADQAKARLRVQTNGTNQAPAGAGTSNAVLVIDVNNITTYLDDVTNAEKATRAVPTPAIPKPFQNLYGIGDIYAVNGLPAHGTWSVFTGLMFLVPVDIPGYAINDTFRGGIAVTNMEILNEDYSPRGTIMGVGLAGGPAPPLSGAFGLHFGNVAIAGGTGEFVGVRGVLGESTNPTDSFRFASTAEDPSIRRQVNGGRLTFVVSLVR